MSLTIYGITKCKWCDSAVSLAKEKGLSYDYRNMDSNINFYTELKGLVPKFKTVPQIFWGTRHVGGYTDLEREIETNTLGDDDGKNSGT